ncbi:MAG: uroporphyrinogen-III C-methyltransferase [Succinivibrionaceae bacterium]|nr:uroporphyrinogen-III C-methyltransferase [Succinivibrionaceae bacterium]
MSKKKDQKPDQIDLEKEEKAIEAQAGQIRAEEQESMKSPAAESPTPGDAPSAGTPAPEGAAAAGEPVAATGASGPEPVPAGQGAQDGNPAPAPTDAQGQSEAEAEAITPVAVRVPRQSFEPHERYVLDQLSAVKSRNGFLAFLCFLLLLGVLGCVWYTYTQVTTTLSDLPSIKERYAESAARLAKADEQMRLLVAKNDSLSAQNGKLADATADLGKRVDGLNSAHEAQVEGLKATNSRLERYEARNPSDWLLAESFFMVNNAYQLAILGQDTKGAQWCLNRADSLLRDVTGTEVEPIRRALKQDLLALEGVNRTDTIGLCFKLDSVLGNLSAMNLKGYSDPDRREAAFSKDSKPTSDLGDWKENLISSAKDFSSRFIEIRRRDDNAATEFLTPDQKIFLGENIQTHLTTAKFALLRSEQGLYDHSLDEAMRLIKAYYDEGSAACKANLATLAQLREENILTEMPTTLASMHAFARLAQDRLGVKVPEAPASGNGGQDGAAAQ